jgi:hypothetical protein
VEKWDLSADTYSRYEIREVARDVNGKVAYSADGRKIICSRASDDGIFLRSTEDRLQPPLTMTMPEMELKTFSSDSDGRCVHTLFVSEDESAAVKRLNIETGDEV